MNRRTNVRTEEEGQKERTIKRKGYVKNGREGECRARHKGTEGRSNKGTNGRKEYPLTEMEEREREKELCGD
jgi:hypothetical protein